MKSLVPITLLLFSCSVLGWVNDTVTIEATIKKFDAKEVVAITSENDEITIPRNAVRTADLRSGKAMSLKIVAAELSKIKMKSSESDIQFPDLDKIGTIKKPAALEK